MNKAYEYAKKAYEPKMYRSMLRNSAVSLYELQMAKMINTSLTRRK